MGNTQLKQGSKKDVQSSVVSDAIAEESSYPIVQSIARLDYTQNMRSTGGQFDKSMRKAGLGQSATQKAERAAFDRSQTESRKNKFFEVWNETSPYKDPYGGI